MSVMRPGMVEPLMMMTITHKQLQTQEKKTRREAEPSNLYDKSLAHDNGRRFESSQSENDATHVGDAARCL